MYYVKKMIKQTFGEYYKYLINIVIYIWNTIKEENRPMIIH